MSGSNRGGYIAAVSAGLSAVFVLAGVLTFSYHLGDLAASKHAQGYSYAAQYPADTDKRIADCPAGASVASLKQCIEEAVTASHDAQRSEKDLSAQRQMADWAFWVLVVSCVGTAITAIGTGFLAIQIKLTREAVEDTGKATLAMERQNEIAEDTARRQLRAYIRVKIGDANIQPDQSLTVDFEYENYGSTPAFQVECSTFVALHPPNWVIPPLENAYPRGPDKTVCQPGQFSRVRGKLLGILPQGHYDLIDAGNLAIFAGFRIYYTDVFGEEWTTRFGISICGNDEIINSSYTMVPAMCDAT